MCQSANSEDVQIEACDEQVPNKVACRQGLNQGASAVVCPDSVIPFHALALIIHGNYPYSEDINEATLSHGDYMSVPVEAPLARQLGVVLGCEDVGEDGRYRPEDQRV